MRKIHSILAVIGALGAAGIAYAYRPANSDAWRADYQELRGILARSYANLGYAVESGLPIRALDSATRVRLEESQTVRGAKGALSDFVAAFQDPHLKLVSGPPEFVRYLFNTKSEPPVLARTTSAAEACEAMGYEDGIGGGYSLPFDDLAGFRAARIEPNTFNAGSVPGAAGKRVGILRISLFSPHRSQTHCRKAWDERGATTSTSCRAACQDSIYIRTGVLLAQALRESIAVLEQEGVSSILVDIGGNGGGSEWVGLALRAVVAAPLKFPVTLVTGTGAPDECQWDDAIARRCSNLKRADADSEAVAIFTAPPIGRNLPLYVLVDAHTASAAEYFAAVLQDNRVAQIIGTRTMGAGCGYVNGGGEYTLSRTRLRFRAPNCVRLRKDGSNERAGIRPDIELSTGSAGVDRARHVLTAATGLAL